MVSKRKKKYTTGEGAQFMSRKQALKKLQLSLNDFRRLCILKGIYPREPRNRKRAQKGDISIKTLYHVKDIQFLLHEPIIWQLRDFKVFNRKVGRVKAIKDFRTLKQYVQRHPSLTLEHVVKERYPTFADALRDLDDCLTLCFLFSTFPSLPHIPRDQSNLCQRLTLEFQHAIIELKALRKVFISIKGYYYQAEIKGETVTWIVPHHFSFEPQNKAEVDFKLMSIFVEFYTVMLGSVNWRLYHELNLHYPPAFSHLSQTKSEQKLVDEGAYVSERIGALSVPLLRASNAEKITEVPAVDDGGLELDPAVIEEAEKIEKLKTLFKGLKIFVSREVPREPITFVVRCFGGEVSWDSTLFVGSTFDEDCTTITHQIVDRPTIDKKYITRYYVQPQWLFDSVNARQLLPESKYFIGVTLPPHLSPFVDREERDQQYIPPEERAGYDFELLEQMHKKDEGRESDKSDAEESDEEMDAEASESDDDDDEEVDPDENDESEEEEDKEQSDDEKTAQIDGENEEEDSDQSEGEDGDEKDEKSSASSTKNPKGAVVQGQVHKEIPWQKERLERQEYRLREKLVKNKYRKLYKSMMAGRKERAKEIWLLRKKRRLHDEKVKEEMEQNKKKKREERKGKESLKSNTKQKKKVNEEMEQKKNVQKKNKKNQESGSLKSNTQQKKKKVQS